MLAMVGLLLVVVGICSSAKCVLSRRRLGITESEHSDEPTDSCGVISFASEASILVGLTSSAS